ncbi:hypothetical protein BDC45DRAFT_493312 [Circinella umbellata]|nr:hypothetical protein BDC45DRAFT_493312 [Circinella umbellata]
MVLFLICVLFVKLLHLNAYLHSFDTKNLLKLRKLFKWRMVLNGIAENYVCLIVNHVNHPSVLDQTEE